MSIATNLPSSSGRSAGRTWRSKTSPPSRAISSGLRCGSVVGIKDLRTSRDLDLEGNVPMPIVFSILLKRHAQRGRRERLPGQVDHRVEVTADALFAGEGLHFGRNGRP